jgi:RNA recognition motif-containing protein
MTLLIPFNFRPAAEAIYNFLLLFVKSVTAEGISCVFLPKTNYMNLFVAGLPYDLDDDELMEIFEKFGEVNSAKVAMDKETGKSRGFGFVDMKNEADAKDAIENLNDISLGKKPLVVKAADERPQGGGPSHNSGGGGFRGGFNGNNNRGGSGGSGGSRGGGGGFNRPPGNNRGGSGGGRRY